MTTVSIIIPTYNNAQYLPDALQSCITQTYKDIEIIVVDDGSTDDTRSLVSHYPVTYLYQNNRGAAAARNTGWQASSSEFLQFLDADDVLLPTKIERCLQAFTDDVDVVYTDFEYRSADLQAIVPSGSNLRPEGNIFTVLLEEFIALFPPHAPLVRRTAAERTGHFNERLRITEDWYFWIELAANGAIFKYLNEKLAIYRMRPNSSSRDKLRMAQDRLIATQEFQRLPLPASFDLNRRIADRYHMLAMNLWRLNENAQARKHFWHAIRQSKHSMGARSLLILMSYMTNAPTAERTLDWALRVTGKIHP